MRASHDCSDLGPRKTDDGGDKAELEGWLMIRVRSGYRRVLGSGRYL